MNDVEQIFDTFAEMSKIVHRADAIRKKQNDIRSLNEKRCGHCDKWMKPSCKLEEVHGMFMSIDDWGCSGWITDPWMVSLIAQRNAELKELLNNE